MVAMLICCPDTAVGLGIGLMGYGLWQWLMLLKRRKGGVVAGRHLHIHHTRIPTTLLNSSTTGIGGHRRAEETSS